MPYIEDNHFESELKGQDTKNKFYTICVSKINIITFNHHDANIDH